MTNAMMERERIHHYTKDEMWDVFDRDGTQDSDASYISAIFIDPQVVNISGDGQALNMPTKSATVFETETGPTGFYHPTGKGRVILLNTEDMLDYDLISELHQQKDAHAYLWLTQPFEGGDDFERINEWYRDETYTDTFKEDQHG